MKFRHFVFVGLMVFTLLSLVSFASAQTDVYYFYGDGCPHCAKVSASGVLDDVSEIEGVLIERFNVRDEGVKYNFYRSKLGIPPGWPLVIIEDGDNLSYLLGEEDIIELLESSLGGLNELPYEISFGDRINLWLEDKFYENFDSETGSLGFIGWLVLIISAFIDSINPCAFGVLIFLMLSLLKMGSAKRALKAGLVYTLVVFIVYFLAGFGIFSVIQSFTSITHYIYISAGVLVLALGFWQFKDALLPNFGPTLQISPKVKPLMENIIQKGTIPAMILLGVVVSLFELPCTGGIYLAIITILLKFDVFPMMYLLIYNLIFVLPLIILTLMIYKGMSPEILQRWTQSEKKWMKIGSGMVLVALGIYILLF